MRHPHQRGASGPSALRVVLYSTALLTVGMFLGALYLVGFLGLSQSPAVAPALVGQVVQVQSVLPTPPQQQQQQGAASLRAPKRLKVAYAITITKDGPYLDGAAVMKHSIERLSSPHDVEYVAIVHAGVQSTRPSLAKLGMKIVEFEMPLSSSEIRGEHLRETIDKSGCCGTSELLKLRAFQLTQYDRVVLLDMDTAIKQPLDHLFDIDKEIIFTYDHAMDGPGTAAPPAQGGFFVLKPSLRTYDRFLDIMREGDFRPSSGWAGSGIGWCYGGQTIQGVVSYYYNRVDPANKHILDHCTYNAMVSTKECESTPFDKVISIHYTVCQKPWECNGGSRPLCKEMEKFWWDVRRSLERKLGLPQSTTNGCKSRRREYTPLFP